MVGKVGMTDVNLSLVKGMVWGMVWCLWIQRFVLRIRYQLGMN